MTRQIPDDAINLFRLTSTLIREYEQQTGRRTINLSLGNPDTAPPPEILALQAKLAADPASVLHTSAEDENLNDFAEGMVELHGLIRSAEHEQLSTLPIPGIKTASTLLALACGLHRPDAQRRRSFRFVTNQPAYDVCGTWAGPYLGAERIVWPLVTEDKMRLNVGRLEQALRQRGVNRADLILVVRPGNPAPVGATREEWQRLIEHCLARGTRLVNDAAYTGLAYQHHVALATVAIDYPELEWIELYSVSKSFSDTGARLGALVGSKDFVEDFRMVKGNTDSGPVPYIMAAYGTYLRDQQRAEAALADLRSMYQRRLGYLADQLRAAGLEPACATDAGFFTLWKTPHRVLGIDLATDPRVRGLPRCEAFNRTVIRETGIIGVHFQGAQLDGEAAPLMRYAVCADVLNPVFQAQFEEQLARLQPEYGF